MSKKNALTHLPAPNNRPFNVHYALGLNIFIHINENKNINKQFITMVYDGIQKEAIRLIRICFPFITLLNGVTP